MDDKIYIHGIAAGIVAGIILVLFIVLRNRKKGLSQYDERQMIGRGKAFQAGFITLLCGMALLFLDGFIYELPGSPFLWKFGVLMAGLMVYVLTSIHYDAYLTLTDTPKRMYTTGLLLAAAMGLSAVNSFMNHSAEDAWIGWINVALAVSWLITMAAMLIHNRRRKEDEE